jgi:hypothetical protein
VKTFSVNPTSRVNVSVGGAAPELQNALGQVWAAGHERAADAPALDGLTGA